MLARTMCALSCARATPVSATAKNASATILGRFFMLRSCCHHWPRLQGMVRGVLQRWTECYTEESAKGHARWRTKVTSAVGLVAKTLGTSAKFRKVKNLLWLCVSPHFRFESEPLSL